MRPGPLHWDQSVGFYAGFRFGVRKDSTPLEGTREVSPAGQDKTAHDSLGRTGHHCHGSCAEARGVRLRRGTGQVVAGGDTAPGPLDVLDG